jgi:hypothetical protein
MPRECCDVASCRQCRQTSSECPPKRMRRATGLRKASDCRDRAERQGGGARGLCWLDVDVIRSVVRFGYETASGRNVGSVVGYYKQTPAGRRMSRTDVAFGAHVRDCVGERRV